MQGYNARLAGDYDKSLDLSQQAIDACGNSNELDPCGYALFEKGLALNRSGKPDEAIPVLEERLDRFGDNPPGRGRQGAQGREEGGGGLSTFDGVAAAVAGVPFMSPEQGRVVYDHVRATRPAEVLELGTAHGVGAAYMAAALRRQRRRAAGHRRLRRARATTPRPEQVLARAGVADRVEVVREFSSYTWWLKEQVQARSDAHGNCEPRFDFVYLDGAKNWTVDGLAVVLVEKLLRPGGWLLMDDLDWTYAQDPGPRGDRRDRPSRAVRARAHRSRTCARCST